MLRVAGLARQWMSPAHLGREVRKTSRIVTPTFGFEAGLSTRGSIPADCRLASDAIAEDRAADRSRVRHENRARSEVRASPGLLVHSSCQGRRFRRNLPRPGVGDPQDTHIQPTDSSFPPVGRCTRLTSGHWRLATMLWFCNASQYTRL